MSRVFIAAAFVIVAVMAIIWFSSGEQTQPEVASVTEHARPDAADAKVPKAPRGAPPAGEPAAAGEAPQDEQEIEVKKEVEVVESMREKMDAARRLSDEQAVRALDRQELHDGIEAPGQDNERVSAMGKQLPSANLGKADLRLIDLSQANATEADLTEAKLQGADLSRATLLGAKLNGADLTGAVIDGADMRGAQLENATLSVSAKLTDLRNSNLDGASLDGSDLARADLRNASLRGASLGAFMHETDLRLADLRGADFLDAVLTATNFEGADLTEANNLTCDQLRVAVNWASARRPPELECGYPLPEPPKTPAAE